MTSIKPSKQPLAHTTNNRIKSTNTRSNEAEGLHALLKSPPKRAVIQSREIVVTNKSDILKALRRGHRVEDIAQALSIPNRTFIRRLKELNISARSVRNQYQRSA
jgi:DNA-binding NarL/FixJ family response regulator